MFPPEQTFTILLKNESSQVPIAGSLANFDQAKMQNMEKAMTGSEVTYYQDLKHEVRRKSYVLGRYAAKRAVAGLSGVSDLSTIEIKKGILEQPVVYLPNAKDSYGVSISHVDNLAAALSFPLTHPCALDLEIFDSEAATSVTTVLTAHERTLTDTGDQDPLITNTILWTAKEAVCKVTQVGLTTPPEILEIRDLELTSENQYSIRYTNFFQYRCHVWLLSGVVVAVVIPKDIFLDSAKVALDLGKVLANAHHNFL